MLPLPPITPPPVAGDYLAVYQWLTELRRLIVQCLTLVSFTGETWLPDQRDLLEGLRHLLDHALWFEEARRQLWQRPQRRPQPPQDIPRRRWPSHFRFCPASWQRAWFCYLKYRAVTGALNDGLRLAAASGVRPAGSGPRAPPAASGAGGD